LGEWLSSPKLANERMASLVKTGIVARIDQACAPNPATGPGWRDRVTTKITLTTHWRLTGIFLVVALGLGLGWGQSPQPQPIEPVADANAHATTPSVPQRSAAYANPDEYVISPEDVLTIYVFDVPELSRDYTVSTGGTITVPLLTRPVQAAGLTLNQFARSLEENFREPGVLSHPQVSVDVKQSRRSVVTVEGAVRTPQSVPVIGRTRLLSVLDQCGGLADDAGNTIKVTQGLRPRVDGRQGSLSVSSVVSLEVKKLMDTNDPTSSFEVWPGDRVSVEHAGVFYVLGEVNRPGGYNLKTAQEQVTVLQALAIAGDVTSVAKKDKVKIIRKDPKAPAGRMEVSLDVKNIINGRSPDPFLETNDILYVPASGPRRVGRTFTSSATSIVAGAGTVVYRR